MVAGSNPARGAKKIRYLADISKFPNEAKFQLLATPLATNRRFGESKL
jgi:hypothetical protein